jgi:uncharacterized pyridoxamine 5'-phosphate oxidase family protein
VFFYGCPLRINGRREEKTMEEVYEFLKKCQIFFLATEEGDQPRVRPFGAVNVYNGKLYLLTGKVKKVSKQIAANPKVELCACDGGNWLRVSATLVEDNSFEAQESMLDAYPSMRPQYLAGDGNTQVLYLKDAVAVFYSLSGEPRTVTF